jgi:tyrosine-protein kinase Etk/Wzc
MSKTLSLSDINGSNFSNSTKLSTKDVVLKYFIYLPLFIIVLIVTVGVSYLYIRYKSPVYSSSISVFFPEGSKGAGSSPSDMNGLGEIMMFNKKVNLANEIEVLKTKTVMSRVVNKLNLNLLYYKKGKIKKSELYQSPVISAKVTTIKDSSKGESIEIVKDGNSLYWLRNKAKTKIEADSNIVADNIAIHVSIDPNSLSKNERYVIAWMPVSDIADQFSAGLGISQPQRDANILNLSIETEVPKKGTDILNSLVEEYNLRNNEQKNRLVDYTLHFIDDRIDLMRGELGRVEGSIQSYRQANEIVAPQAQNSEGISQLSDAKAKIDNSDVKMQVINMVKESVINPNQPIPTTLGIDDPTLSSLVQQYNSLQFQKEEQLKTMPAANPTVKITQSQIEKLRGSILSNLENITTSTKQLKQRYVGEFQSNRAKLNDVPRQERQLLEIGRQQDIKEKLFMFLLQKKEEAAITKASQLSANATPLDPALTTSLISPNASYIYKIGIFLGFLLPILFIYLKELLNDKIITRSDITAKTRTPIIGEVSHNPEKKRKLVVGFEDRTVLGEQFRMIRTNIPFLTRGHENKVLLVTSTTPAEGKTFCSLNVAAVYALAGKKTVIVEMDLRKPKIANSLKINNSVKGITHYITGQASFEEIIADVPDFANLYVLPAGIIPPNPSEILMDQKIERLFGLLKENFDCIVIDSPPLGLVSDTKLIAKYADATIYIVRQRVTSKKFLSQVNELYADDILPNLSILVNDVKAGGADSYYGYTGNYMSTYKYGYGHEPKTIWEKAKTAIKL